MSYLVQLGTYNPLLDTFTPVLDCNDGTTLELADRDGLVMPPPALDLYAAANPRLPGQRITAQNYGSRSIRLTLAAGPLATYAALQAVLQTLYTLQEQTRLARQSVQSGDTSPHHGLPCSSSFLARRPPCMPMYSAWRMTSPASAIRSPGSASGTRASASICSAPPTCAAHARPCRTCS